MRPERWQQVREVLDNAIALSADERGAYLDEVCSGDMELHAEVKSLLRSHLEAGSVFLVNPAVDLKNFMPDAGPMASRVGRRIGVYLIMAEIGHGGMGEIYRAARADGQYDKQVAIKFVRGGFDTSFVLERFRHERQILASLDHPNIARLHDGGTTEDGVPYLVMELIEGTPIDQYCENRQLGIPERLVLFNQVCSAVQYAHQRLVIHRDIKPSNILVTGEGIPKLLDFGIAKILDSSAGAETTLIRPMTPEYASPEQVRGEPITTATDVYSLGVLLYKLFTGKSPYPPKTRSPIEFAKAICETEPARPSSVAEPVKVERLTEDRRLSTNLAGSSKYTRALKGDLDNIVLKTLRKEPTRRYGSVEQLAEDIRRHLCGLPVMATPDSASYRVSKFVHRHNAGVAAAALIAVAVAGGVGATLREARIAVLQRARAERRFSDVRKLANSFLFEFDDAIKNLPGSTPARSLVVKRALKYLDGLATEARGDRSLQAEIAYSYQKVAEVQGDPIFPNLGDPKGALESSRKSLAILETLSRDEPENEEDRRLLAGAHQQISDVLSFSGDTAGAVEHSGEALRLYESLPGKASNPKLQSERVTQTYHYANLVKSAGRLDEAEAEYRQAAELSRRMIAVSPSDPDGKVHLATSLDGLGTVLQEKGDTAGALENRRRALAIREELARLDPDNAHYRRQVAFSHHNVGLSLVEAGDLASALANYRTELNLFESLGAADPKDVQARRNRSLAHKQIGDVSMRTADVRGALSQYRAALELDRYLASVNPGNAQALLDLSRSETKVGSALGKLGQTQEALAMLRSGLARQESLIAKDPHDVRLYDYLASNYSLLANCLRDSADTKAAAENYRKAIAVRLTLSEKNPDSSANRGALAECDANLAKTVELSDRNDALKQYSNAIELLEHLITIDRSNAQYRITLGGALSNMARLYTRMAAQDGEPSIRLPYWTKARSVYEPSQELSLELDRTGELPPTRGSMTRQVSRELARCNEALRLNPNEDGLRSAEATITK